jgi:hypothetical protein
MSTPEAPEKNGVDPAVAIGDAKFDFSQYRLPQNYQNIGVKKALLVVPVRKPDKTWWVRTHPSSEFQLEALLLEDKDGVSTKSDQYLVLPATGVADALGSLVKPVTLRAAITRQGVLFVWWVKLAGDVAKTDKWTLTGLDAMERAESKWVRVAPNMALGAYDVVEFSGNIPEPVWPEYDFMQILGVAFKGLMIDGPNHPVVRRLMGLE